MRGMSNCIGAIHARTPIRPRDHARRFYVPDAYSVFRLSRGAVVFWRAMGAERSLVQYRTCPSHPLSFYAIVFFRLRCRELRARGNSDLHAGADLDCFGVIHRDFGGAGSLQVRALISVVG